jgi:hypothetical protein
MKAGLLSPSRQIAFHQLLVAARKSVLMDALSEALGTIDPAVIKNQVVQYVPADVQRIPAASRVREMNTYFRCQSY